MITRRRSFRLSIARVVALAIAAVAAATLGLTGSSRAASPGVCTTPSVPPTTPGTPGTASSCVTQTLTPLTVTVGADGVSITRFDNQGTSTATHLSITQTFSAPVTIKSITLVLNGSVTSSSTCTPTPLPSVPVMNVSCTDVGNVPGGSFAKLIVRYSAGAVGSIQVFGFVRYGESSSDKQGGPNGTVNDQQWSNVVTVTVVTADPNASGKPLQAGKCTTFTGTETVAGGDTTLSATAIYSVTVDPLLPCTPAAAGVIPGTFPNIQTAVAFAEVPQTSPSSFVTVIIAFTPLPPNTTLKKLVLLENTAVPPNPLFTTFITVPGCDAGGLPPNPGTPFPGAMDSDPHENDSCIFSRSSLPKGGGELVLHVLGTGGDPGFGGG